jgi:hypothetical protein
MAAEGGAGGLFLLIFLTVHLITAQPFFASVLVKNSCKGPEPLVAVFVNPVQQNIDKYLLLRHKPYLKLI